LSGQFLYLGVWFTQVLGTSPQLWPPSARTSSPWHARPSPFAREPFCYESARSELAARARGARPLAESANPRAGARLAPRPGIPL